MMSDPEELFTNEAVDVKQLPAAESLQMTTLEPAYKTVRYISGFIIAAIITAISWGVVIMRPDTWPEGFYIAGLLSAIGIWIIIYNGISFHHMGYAVREKDISFKSGYLWRSMTTVPFNRVQHCDFKQGLLDRRFGLARLTIYTAGGQNTDLMIPGLLPENAERLKTFILASTEQSVEENQ